MKIFSPIINMTSAIADLFFPPVCVSCGTHLFKQEVEICQMCIRRLPRTNFEKQPHENKMSLLMWGRCHVEQAYSLFYYKKGERVQRLLHEIKYRRNMDLGKELGRQLGKVIQQAKPGEYDCVIPIPLHPKKLRQRGFNQAELIADGLAEVLSIPMDISSVKRSVHTESQTRKGRFERWQNVENIFQVSETNLLNGKHVLLVDDVITTGSTMEACINTIRQVDGAQVSMATIACAVL
ncbi:MAG: ComF family protein [Carboxylicivirga sp.]|jgi:ComF family protein|nr:ComF family protein [Carboxylicivirga sp.]